MNKYPCPCCRELTLPDQGEFDICTVCFWEDDPLQAQDPDDDLGANTLSLNDYRIQFYAKQKPTPTRQLEPMVDAGN